MKVEENNREMSPVDELYFKLTGEKFKKAGTAFERLATACMSLAYNTTNASHDIHAEGQSGAKHQLDGVLNDTIILEAKDHAIAGDKVGLGEVQEHQGAMLDINNVEEGIFAWSTDFTSEAYKYLKSSPLNNRMITTYPVIIRQSTKEDENGRIKQVSIFVEMPYLDRDKGEYGIQWKDRKYEDDFCDVMRRNNINRVRLQIFFDKEGNFLFELSDIIKNQIPEDWDEHDEITGVFHINAYIKVGQDPVYIEDVKYRIPVSKMTDSFVIKAEGDPCVYVKSKMYGIDKLYTDVQLKAALSHLK